MANPQQFASYVEKFYLVVNLGLGQMISTAWNLIFAPDGQDTFYYNNAEAIGNQIYPTGLSKYYDVYSLQGITALFGDWLWFSIDSRLLAPFLLMTPISIWGQLFTLKWDTLLNFIFTNNAGSIFNPFYFAAQYFNF